MRDVGSDPVLGCSSCTERVLEMFSECSTIDHVEGGALRSGESRTVHLLTSEE